MPPQPTFSAINVEPEENVDEEIDTTREIHVDDALKRFQTALKLHAQGPRFFDEASDAYDALFESDIFRYPEGKTEYERNERRPDGSLVIEPVFTPGLEDAGADGDEVDSSLPQAFYLSYKNHGQFIVDRIRHKARAAPAAGGVTFDDPAVINDARKALDDFNAALDRDPSDAELWRKTSRIAAFLKSARISRYSLEAAIELDDDPAVVDVEPPSLAESFAGEQLKERLEVLGDEMALTHPIMKPFRERGLPPLLKRHLDPIPFLPDPTKSVATPSSHLLENIQLRLTISLSNYSWTELGLDLIQLVAEQGFSGQGVFIQLPEPLDEAADDDVQMEIDKQLQPPEEPVTSDKQSEVTPVDESAIVKGQHADPAANEATPTIIDSAVQDEPVKERRTSLPTRKRSQSAAGLPEQADDDNAETKRSKRTRRRDTAVEEVMDPVTLLATQLQPFQAADQNLFQTTKNLLENLGVTDGITLDRIAEILDSCASDDRTAKIQNPATTDLREAIMRFEEDTATMLLSKKESPQLSLTTFLEHSKSGSQRLPEAPAFDDTRNLRRFVDKLNQGWHTVHDIVYEYVRALTKTYTQFKWSDQLKTVVVQVISRLDEAIHHRLATELQTYPASDQEDNTFLDMVNIIYMLFELHLDVYERITNPNSVVDQSIRLETKARLERWLNLATAVSRRRSRDTDDSLSIRFLWGAVVYTTLTDDISRDHILTCWHALRDHLAGSPVVDINLPNNSVMPDISTSAAEREISKLTTMDFFLGLFQEDMGDPISVIDNLEPVLNPDSVYVNNTTSEHNGDGTNNIRHKQAGQPIKECASQGLRDLWKFLQGSSTELRLLLWTRLGAAYGKIGYITKQFSCFLRSIETIVSDFEREEYISLPQESRRVLFITMLKALDDHIIQSLHLALNDNSAFDIIDEDHLRSTLSALAKVNCLLHTASMYEDEVRIGMTLPPATSSIFTSFLVKLREMQVRTWSLQYTVIKVGINLHAALFPKAENDLMDYLAAVHQVIGLRKICKSSNKIFPKMMRVELLKQKEIENWEDYLGQVLYDLHGLKLGVGIWEVQDHGCPADKLEKRQAMALVDKVSILANRMTMKDLLKSDLKTTIEHMQNAIGSFKSTPQMFHNLRNFTEYLKTPIHPLHLYQALTGNTDLDAVTINTPDSAPAKQGWWFLLGMIALTRFKGVDLNRRQTPGATDDLRLAAAHLRLQLQFTPDRWNAWFRLAECFDYELDEAVLWTADKMNKDRAELVKFQRNAIHCYTLALSHSYAWRSDPSAFTASEEDADALYDLYHRFGMRMYASSREPFAMEPFQHADQQRFFIEEMGAGTYKKILHHEMSDYHVWKFAAKLFTKAMEGKPKDWKNPYMVAKCLWKMYQKPVEALDAKNRLSRPTVQTVIRALEKTIEVTSSLPKPRNEKDTILEPHYKILSVIHKLVTRDDLPAQEGADILCRQPYAPDRGLPVTIKDGDDWEAYVIKSLRFLRDKDKSNWQHRFLIRHARILLAENEGDAESEGSSVQHVAAKAAYIVLRESMFTKTMILNVWKCEAERPGRHYVYMEQYIRFMIRLLGVMNDRVNMEAVLRRIRKRGTDFYHFNELWQHGVQTYLKLVRQTFSIPLTEEDAFKSLSPEEFDTVGERITEWAATSEAESHSALAALKEVTELKKLNANLMKAGPIDDLISDCYSAIYLDIKSTFPSQETATDIKMEERAAEDSGTEAVVAKKTLLGDGLLLNPLRDKELTMTTLGSLRASSEQLEKSEKQLSVTGEAAPRVGRRAAVRRPDILRKAEQAVLRAAEGPPKAAGANGETSSKSRRQSASSTKNGIAPREEGEDDEDDHNNCDDDSHHRHHEDEDVEMKDANGDGERDGGLEKEGAHDEHMHDENGSEISSPPGSVHDSADDESDLSDVPPDYEDHVPASLLFPNLRRSVDAGTAAGTAAGDSSDESTEDEEEGEEDEEEEGEEMDQGEGGDVSMSVGEGEVEGEEEDEEEEGEEVHSHVDEDDGGAEVGAEVEDEAEAELETEVETEVEGEGEVEAIEVDEEEEEGEEGDGEEGEETEEGEDSEEAEEAEEGEEEVEEGDEAEEGEEEAEEGEEAEETGEDEDEAEEAEESDEEE
ncbi:hypothetical protein B0T17DRAFT_504394 [Bombardia bombarda]|uniref:Histone transcription regulator 3 homolog n=1 Tax=Bombardia bombarda TaxID=252184 RepID=A0AA40CFW9_9PEZI|nr:hypothetical protein B0T17DRAFT_504394 [Bombardia bombarda]